MFCRWADRELMKQYGSREAIIQALDKELLRREFGVEQNDSRNRAAARKL
jgi:hypothetical protein